MTCDIEELDLPIDDFYSYLDWCKQNGIWDGRPVYWNQTDQFALETELNILDLMNSENFQILAGLAWVGSTPENRLSIEKEIQALQIGPNGILVQTGFGKSLSKFWKKHKKEILIGAAVVAVVTTIVVVTVCSGGAAGAGTAALAGAGGAVKDDPEEPDEKAPSPQLTSSLQPLSLGKDHQIEFYEEGLSFAGKKLTYQELIQEQKKESLREFLCPDIPRERFEFEQNYEKQFVVPFQLDLNPSTLEPTSEEESFTSINPPQIGFINGMATRLEEAQAHATYLNQLIPDGNEKVNLVYNKTNNKKVLIPPPDLSLYAHPPTLVDMPLDLAEIFLLNQNGISPNTAKPLKQIWQDFHEAYIDSPRKKYLQICHSQGAIHVRNALLDSPQEIRDRVMVVAIAPGTIVPQDICFDSFNYASKNDIVPMAEILLDMPSSLDADLMILKNAPLEKYNQIIFLDPHEDAKGFDHEFQSPTFSERLEFHIKDYYTNDGEYK